MNYILTGDAAKYYNVSPELISHYDISIISQEMRVPVDYLQLIQNIAADIKSSYGELITLQVSHELDEKKEKKGIFGFLKKK